jgi:hypothetical protein
VNATPDRNLDGAGMAVSTLCAIHCVAMPLLAASLASAGVGWLRNEAFEWLIVTGSFLLGIWSLLPGFRHRHGKKRCLWLFSGGMAAIFAGKLIHFGSLPDTPFVVSGAVLIVVAHTTNQYLCRRCRCTPVGDADEVLC